MINQETIRVPFRKYITYNAKVNLNFLFTLVPNNLGDVIAAMRTSFGHWRMNALRVKIFSASQPVALWTSQRESGPGLVLGLGYTAIDPTKFSSTPSWNSATQLPIYNMGPAIGTSISVPLAELRRTTVPWLETTSTGSESEAFQSAGSLYYGNLMPTATADGYDIQLLLEGEIEFRDRIDNAVSVFTQPVVDPDEKSCGCDDSSDCEVICVRPPPAASPAPSPPHSGPIRPPPEAAVRGVFKSRL